MSCGGSRRGGDGCTCTGGRQPGGGGVLGGGPAYPEGGVPPPGGPPPGGPGHAPPATVQPSAASGRAHGLSVAASRDHGLAFPAASGVPAVPAASGVSAAPAAPVEAPAVSIPPVTAGSAAGVLGSGWSGRRQVSSSGLPPLGVVTPSDATNAPAGRPPDASITATPAPRARWMAFRRLPARYGRARDDPAGPGERAGGPFGGIVAARDRPRHPDTARRRRSRGRPQRRPRGAARADQRRHRPRLGRAPRRQRRLAARRAPPHWG